MDNCELTQFEEKHKLMEIFNSAKQIAGIKSVHKLYLDSNDALVTCLQEGEGENEDAVEEPVVEEHIVEHDIVEKGVDKDVNEENKDEEPEASNIGVSSLKEMDISNVKTGEWVLVNYEGEVFIRKVMEKLINNESKEAKVHCIERPYGIKEPLNMEPENHVAFYLKVYECKGVPSLIAHKRSWKYSY